LDMSRIHPECPDSAPSDADALLRQEPDEEEDEEEEEDTNNKEKEDNDEGYSE
jgi:hypothetical protein